jgi:hypothetical protein
MDYLEKTLGTNSYTYNYVDATESDSHGRDYSMAHNRINPETDMAGTKMANTHSHSGIHNSQSRD